MERVPLCEIGAREKTLFQFNCFYTLKHKTINFCMDLYSFLLLLMSLYCSHRLTKDFQTSLGDVLAGTFPLYVTIDGLEFHFDFTGRCYCSYFSPLTIGLCPHSRSTSLVYSLFYCALSIGTFSLFISLC